MQHKINLKLSHSNISKAKKLEQRIGKSKYSDLNSNTSQFRFLFFYIDVVDHTNLKKIFFPLSLQLVWAQLGPIKNDLQYHFSRLINSPAYQ